MTTCDGQEPELVTVTSIAALVGAAESQVHGERTRPSLAPTAIGSAACSDGIEASIRDAFCADLRYEPAQVWATLGDAAMRWDVLQDLVLRFPRATRGHITVAVAEALHASTQEDVAVELGLLSTITQWRYTPKTSDGVEAFYYFLRTSASPNAKRLYVVIWERFTLVAVSKMRELRASSPRRVALYTPPPWRGRGCGSGRAEVLQRLLREDPLHP